MENRGSHGILCVLILSLATASVNAATYTWNASAGGNWSDISATGWNAASYPQATSDTANITTDITADATINIDVSNARIGNLTLGDGDPGTAANWTIASSNGTNALTMNKGSSSPGITSQTGSNTISAPIIIAGTGSSLNFVTVGTQLTVSGVISEASAGRSISTHSSSTGILYLSAANTYTGATSLNGGVLSTNLLANGGVASGIGMSSSDAANLILNGGTLRYVGAAVTIDRGFSLPQGSTTNGTLDASGTGALTITGDLRGGGGTTAKTLYLTGTSTAANTLAGVLADGVSGSSTRITKTGTGTWALSGDNTYTGATTVNDGVLLLSTTTALPGGTTAAGGISSLVLNGGVVGLGADDFLRPLGTGTGRVQFGSGGGGFAAFGADRIVNLGGASSQVTWNDTTNKFVLTGSSLILGASTADHMVDFQNPINLSWSVRTVQVNNGSAAVDARLSGELSGIAGAGGLEKAGEGTLELTAVETYTGPTVVTAGTLLVNGSLASGSAVSVAAGARLGGTGTIGGSVALTGGTLHPGHSPGVLSVGGDLSMGDGSTFAVDIGGNTPGNLSANYGQLHLTKTDTLTLTIGDDVALDLAMTGGYGGTVGDVYFILTRADADSFAGNLFSQAGSPLAEGSFVSIAGLEPGLIAQITYLANWTGTQAGSSLIGGNDVAVVILAPEPASVALLACSCVLLLPRRKK